MGISLPPPAIAAEALPLLRQRTPVGGVYCIHENYALANLQLQGDYVVVRRGGRAPLSMNSIERFWSFTRERLQVVRNIRCEFLHLYLGEMCFRFNHREADLAALLRELLQSTSSADVRSVLSRAAPQTPSVGVPRFV